MKTINKIGIAALERIFGDKTDSVNDHVREFGTSGGEYVLTVPSKPEPFRSSTMGVEYNSGRTYLVWGIKLGLKELKGRAPTLLDEIALLEEVPSHLIERTWSVSEQMGTKEVYIVHRLSQRQEDQVSQRREDLKEDTQEDDLNYEYGRAATGTIL